MSRNRIVRMVLFLALCVAPSLAHAASLDVAWNASTTPGVTGYWLNYGVFPGTYTRRVYAGNQTRFRLKHLVPGQRYFIVVVAQSPNGAYSDASNELCYRVPETPLPPAMESTVCPDPDAV